MNAVLRKIDSMGRLSIPKAMRMEYGLMEGDEVEVDTYEDKNGDVYVRIKTPTNTRERDAEILAKYGMKKLENGTIVSA